MSSSPLPSCIVCPSRCLSGPPTAIATPARLSTLRCFSRLRPTPTTAVVGPQLKIAHAPCLTAAMAHACMHARTHSTHATKRKIIPRTACGPFVIRRPYRRGAAVLIHGVRRGWIRGHGSHGTPQKPPQEDCHLLICRRASSRARARARACVCVCVCVCARVRVRACVRTCAWNLCA